jgi:hypothetical protein
VRLGFVTGILEMPRGVGFRPCYRQDRQLGDVAICRASSIGKIWWIGKAARPLVERLLASDQVEVGMLTPNIGVLELIVRATVVYFFLFFLLRFVGKKHVGQMSPFDLVVLLIISETVDASLIGDDKSLTGGLISAATLMVLVYVVGYLTWRDKTFERWFEGHPKILVRHGHVKNRVLADQQVTRSELMEALRQQGCSAVTNVRFAILENDGSISIGKRKLGDAG